MDEQNDQALAMAERVSHAMVNAMAPLIEKLGNEEGREGLIFLATSMVSSGVSLLQECVGDGETAKFIDQVKNQISATGGTWPSTPS